MGSPGKGDLEARRSVWSGRSRSGFATQGHRHGLPWLPYSSVSVCPSALVRNTHLTAVQGHGSSHAHLGGPCDLSQESWREAPPRGRVWPGDWQKTDGFSGTRALPTVRTGAHWDDVEPAPQVTDLRWGRADEQMPPSLVPLSPSRDPGSLLLAHSPFVYITSFLNHHRFLIKYCGTDFQINF